MMRLKSQKGQAAIEFMACIVVIFFFLFLFLSLTVLMVTSEYLDYATFMAARTYKAGGGNEASARTRATDVFNQYVAPINGLARNFKLNFLKTDPNDEQTAGLKVSYTMDLFYLPPIFVNPGSRALENKISLTAESHLGRDPGQEECFQFFQNFLSNVPRVDGGNGNFAVRMEDNGC